MICPSCNTQNEDAAEVCFTCRTILAAAITQGTVLGGRYEVLSPLGKGGMGTVYRAHDRSLDEIVAVKVLRSDLSESPDMARRFRTEIKLARKVRHPNVCGIHEYGEDGRLRFIAMELIDGVDLRRLIRRRGALPSRDAFAVAVQAGEGLQAIHSAGIVHRDLKATNIMVDPEGVVRLMDFGLAKRFEAEPAVGTGLTITGYALGTPEYMSPEQARGRRVDFRSDIYSLGIVVYELFTGRLPFRADTPVATIMMQINDPPPLDGPDTVRISEPLRAVLARALAKDPERRQASGRELVAAIREAQSSSSLNGESLVVHPFSLGQAVSQVMTESSTPTPSSLPALELSQGSTTRTTPRLPEGPATGGPVQQPARPSVRPGHAQGALTLKAQPRGRNRAWWILAAALPIATVAAVMVRPGGTPATAPSLAEPTSSAAPQNAPAPPPVSSISSPGTPVSAEPSRDRQTNPDLLASPPVVRASPSVRPPRPSPTPASVIVRASPEIKGNDALAALATPSLPPAPGTLVVNSEPAASVVLDGDARGSTPARLTGIAPGRHSLALSTDDGRIFQEEIVLAPGATVERSHRFLGFGSLSITSEIWVEVSVDGRPARPTPLRIDKLVAGKHSVRASREGYKEQTLEVEVREGEARRLTIRLEPQ